VYLDGLQVLQVLLDTYKYMPAIYHQLNPSLPNSQGNTILHQAMKAPYSNRALDIVILLCSYNIDPYHRNASGKLAVECVAGGVRDRRTAYVRSLMKRQGLLRQESSSEQVGHEELREDDDSYEAVRGQPLHDDIRVSAVVVDRDIDANECRLFLRQTIDKMDNFVSDLFDGDVSVNGAKKSVTNSGEAVADTGENKARKVEDDNSELKALKAELNREEGPAVFDPDNNQQLLLDEKMFDGLEWEVECTAEVWMFLSNRRVSERAKWKLIWQLRQLAGGDWQPALCRAVENIPAGIRLFDMRLLDTVHVVWQLAVAFSPRRSEANVDTTGLVIRGCIYSEIIRVWDVALNDGQFKASIDRAVKSNLRGKDCIIQKQLTGIETHVTVDADGNATLKRVPRLWMEDSALGKNGCTTAEAKERFYPPGSANEKEYHIMKFYALDSSLVGTALRGESAKVDFPFRVTELEYAIISLRPNPPAPVILLGRSGTGKTTCCLYRLWSNFVRYWTRAVEIGEPWIPRTADFKPIGEADEAYQTQFLV
jgi:hypothetical protein